ncbi:BACON domain-containing protein [Streptomyces abikoensis]|uniref:BACON domain-containing protein n=1 Tax=Streptomyces abikoensis TaxID=97398 RepID=UPI0019C18425|nr:sigma-70 family RNA polymerase sigma factor [Streptomyces abikoensis]GGP76575.1 hypothetical protein GCM10010214_59940 [Streptomyces abikoensis]
MMTSRPEPPTHATGAHRAPSSAPRADRHQVVESTTEHIAYDHAYDHDEEGEEGPGNSPHLDGLFTYCLSVLCDHESAVAALGETLALAERRADRAPAAEEAHRAWLYALARWGCLRRLAERGPGDPPPAPDAGARAELALLAWPEAAGTTAEQREALELAVRHGLAPHEVAAVLRLDLDAARVLLSSAACEVERTRTALAVVESGRCPVVTRFVGDREVLLGAALRRELVRHVDECADCRRTAERAVAGEPWPGTAASPAAALPVLRAPRAAARAAMRGALDARPQRRRAGAQRAATPRFDRGGFPLTPKDRAARRSRLRSRAVTTTVVATVVAAPLLALWAAYRGTPVGEGSGAAPVSATETDSLGGSPHEGMYEGAYADPYEATAPAGPTRRVNGTPGPIGHRFPDVSVAVLGPDGSTAPAPRSAGTAPPAATTPPHAPAGRPAGPVGPAAPVGHVGPGRLTVEAQPSGTATLIKLTADGGEPVSWSMSAGAPWLRLSQPGGVLRPGQSVTVTVLVDHSREPAGPWSARVAIAPGGTVVTIEGCGTPRPTPTPTPYPSTTHPSAPPSP